MLDPPAGARRTLAQHPDGDGCLTPHRVAHAMGENRGVATPLMKNRVRQILANVAPGDLLAIVDQLDLSARPGQASIALVALKSLKQRRKVSSFLDTAPQAALYGMLEAVTQGCLHAIVDELADAADDPTKEQLDAAVTAVLDHVDGPVMAASLAFGVLEEFTAAPHCAAILAEHPEWGLAELFADEATPAAE